MTEALRALIGGQGTHQTVEAVHQEEEQCSSLLH